MPRFLKVLVVLLLVGLIPVRALAALTVGFCGAGHMAAASSMDHGAHHEPPGAQPDPSRCPVCAAHCWNASLAAHGSSWVLPLPDPEARVAVTINLEPGSIPERLDRPPLSL